MLGMGNSCGKSIRIVHVVFKEDGSSGSSTRCTALSPRPVSARLGEPDE